MNEAIRMQVSAFVDGELPENEAELLVRRLSQDAILRQQVAEYLALGRIMRGEISVKGSNRLRERIAAELGERPSQEAADPVPVRQGTRYVRPLAGFAIAASVAVFAILGLRQNVGVDVDPATTTVAAEDVVFETVPVGTDDEIQGLMLLRNKASNTLSSRFTSAEILADEVVDETTGETSESAEESNDDEPVTDQP
jgi:negative regulator of sigma E activity